MPYDFHKLIDRPIDVPTDTPPRTRVEIEEVIEHLQGLPEKHFNMRYWLRKEDCGTVGCIAGWTVILAGHKLEDFATGDSDHKVQDRAARLLGLSDRQAKKLFYGHWTSRSLGNITRDLAIDRLRKISRSPLYRWRRWRGK